MKKVKYPFCLRYSESTIKPHGGFPLLDRCSPPLALIMTYLQCPALFSWPTRLSPHLSRPPFQIRVGEHLLNSCHFQIEKGPHRKQEARTRIILSGKWLGRVQCSGTQLKGKIINVNLTELRVGGSKAVLSGGNGLN